MPPLEYSVAAILPDEATRSEYVAWLVGGHVQAVLAGGAIRAVVGVVADPAHPTKVVARYEFPDQVVLDRYLDSVAPKLRAEGMARFGHLGVAFERSIAEIRLAITS